MTQTTDGTKATGPGSTLDEVGYSPVAVPPSWSSEAEEERAASPYDTVIAPDGFEPPPAVEAAAVEATADSRRLRIHLALGASVIAIAWIAGTAAAISWSGLFASAPYAHPNPNDIEAGLRKATHGLIRALPPFVIFFGGLYATMKAYEAARGGDVLDIVEAAKVIVAAGLMALGSVVMGFVEEFVDAP